MTLTETSLYAAFIEMGVKVNGSGDPTLGDGITGVYFATEPPGLEFDKTRLAALQMAKIGLEIHALEEQPNSDLKVQSEQVEEWIRNAENWLREYARVPTQVAFQKCVKGSTKMAECFHQAQISVSSQIMPQANEKTK